MMFNLGCQLEELDQLPSGEGDYYSAECLGTIYEFDTLIISYGIKDSSVFSLCIAAKMFFKHLVTLFLILESFSNVYAVFFYPNAQSSLLEHILVDVNGEYSSGYIFAVSPCNHYVSGLQTLGRETAAQWLRVAFHDFVTARVDEGTGGMDASIGFETLRDEDSGSAFNDSLTFFRPFVNSKVSMADLIAISVSVSVGNCGGPQIPVRGGRIDATEAGPFGVPAPETDLTTTLGYFANAGFNHVDSIGLTACGHTMGSVHHVSTVTSASTFDLQLKRHRAVSRQLLVLRQ
jgi:hypothetical protein